MKNITLKLSDLQYDALEKLAVAQEKTFDSIIEEQFLYYFGKMLERQHKFMTDILYGDDLTDAEKVEIGMAVQSKRDELINKRG